MSELLLRLFTLENNARTERRAERRIIELATLEFARCRQGLWRVGMMLLV